MLIVGCGGGSSTAINTAPPSNNAIVSNTPSANTIESNTIDGYFNETRFSLSAQACIASLPEQALTVEDGFSITTFSSNELSCTQSENNNHLI